MAKVSEETISQLVDELYQEKVVTCQEKDSILQPRKSRAEMARDVIDKVWKKGEMACRLMIHYIFTIDPMLHRCLGLSSSEPTSPSEFTGTVYNSFLLLSFYFIGLF